MSATNPTSLPSHAPAISDSELITEIVRLRRNRMPFRGPVSQIDQLAAFRAEGPPGIVAAPLDRLAALGAGHDAGGIPALLFVAHGAVLSPPSCRPARRPVPGSAHAA